MGRLYGQVDVMSFQQGAAGLRFLEMLHEKSFDGKVNEMDECWGRYLKSSGSGSSFDGLSCGWSDIRGVGSGSLRLRRL